MTVLPAGQSRKRISPSAVVVLLTLCWSVVDGLASGHNVVGRLPGNVVAMLAMSPRVLVAVDEDSGAVRSTDAGEHWSAWSTGIPTRYVSAFAMNARGDLFAATIGSGIYRQMAGSSTWTRVDTSAPANSLARVPAITISPVDNAIYAATLSYGVYRSSDNGATWRNYNVGLGIMNLNTITVTGDNTVYARCVGGGIFRHAAIWDEWKPINEGLDDPYVTTMDSQHNGTVIIGTRNGTVYRLDKDLKKWEDIKKDFPGYYVSAITSLPDGTILAGTKSGMYKCSPDLSHWELVPGVAKKALIKAMTVATDGTVYAGTATGEIIRVKVGE